MTRIRERRGKDVTIQVIQAPLLAHSIPKTTERPQKRQEPPSQRPLIGAVKGHEYRNPRRARSTSLNRRDLSACITSRPPTKTPRVYSPFRPPLSFFPVRRFGRCGDTEGPGGSGGAVQGPSAGARLLPLSAAGARWLARACRALVGGGTNAEVGLVRVGSRTRQ